MHVPPPTGAVCCFFGLPGLASGMPIVVGHRLRRAAYPEPCPGSAGFWPYAWRLCIQLFFSLRALQDRHGLTVGVRRQTYGGYCTAGTAASPMW